MTDPVIGPPSPPKVEVVEGSSELAGLARDWAGSVGSLLGTAGLVVVLLVFLLIEREGLRDRMLRVVAPGNLRASTSALGDAVERVTHYLRALALLNFGHGAVVAVALFLLGRTRRAAPRPPLRGPALHSISRALGGRRPRAPRRARELRWLDGAARGRVLLPPARARQQQPARALAVRRQRRHLALRAHPLHHLLGLAVGTARARPRDSAHGVPGRARALRAEPRAARDPARRRAGAAACRTPLPAAARARRPRSHRARRRTQRGARPARGLGRGRAAGARPARAGSPGGSPRRRAARGRARDLRAVRERAAGGAVRRDERVRSGGPLPPRARRVGRDGLRGARAPALRARGSRARARPQAERRAGPRGRARGRRAGLHLVAREPEPARRSIS